MWQLAAEIAIQAMHALQVLASHGRLGKDPGEAIPLYTHLTKDFKLPSMEKTYDRLVLKFAKLLNMLLVKAGSQQRKVLASGALQHTQTVPISSQQKHDVVCQYYRNIDTGAGLPSRQAAADEHHLAS